MDWSGDRRTGSYSDSKLFVTALALAVARLWPSVFSNAVDGRVGSDEDVWTGAPDDLEVGQRTQEWLATSDDPEAPSTGGYWHHERRRDPHHAVHDRRFQDELLTALARVTGTTLT